MSEHFEELAFEVDESTVEYGVWCDECLLPSAIKVPIEMRLNGKPCGTQFVTFCADHMVPDEPDDPDERGNPSG